jgi:NAD(P)H dehydrogenase (quinone)
MNVLIVFAHPEPQSFLGQMRDRALDTLHQAGHATQLSDLYTMNFKAVADAGDFLDPFDAARFNLQAEQFHAAQHGTFAPDILEEQQKVLWAEALLLMFPLWWYSTPAILKGWIDRVLAYGFAYGGGRNLRGRRAMLCITTGGPARPYTAEIRQAVNVMLDPLQGGTLHFCGMDVLPPFAAYGADHAARRQRDQFLAQFTALLRGLERITPIDYGG